jgi:hypothetical protein
VSSQPTHTNSHGSAVYEQDGGALHISSPASLCRLTVPARALPQSQITLSPEPPILQPRRLVGMDEFPTKPAPGFRGIGLPVMPPRQPSVIPQTTDQPPKRPNHCTGTSNKVYLSVSAAIPGTFCKSGIAAPCSGSWGSRRASAYDGVRSSTGASLLYLDRAVLDRARYIPSLDRGFPYRRRGIYSRSVPNLIAIIHGHRAYTHPGEVQLPNP